MTTNGTNGTNGASPRPKKLSPGVYCPTVTFFKPTPAQELDLELNAQHFEKLARAGLHGIVVQGSTAEAVSLTPEERKQVSTKAELDVVVFFIRFTCTVAMMPGGRLAEWLTLASSSSLSPETHGRKLETQAQSSPGQ
jgi:hypothetical protein